MPELTEQQIQYARLHIRCNCGHYAKNHFVREGCCDKCGCTWYYPNDKWLAKLAKENKELDRKRSDLYRAIKFLNNHHRKGGIKWAGGN